MLRLISGAAALAAALSLATAPALAAQDKPAPSAPDKPAPGAAGPDKRSFEHVHALAVTADGRTLFIGAHSGLFRSEDAGRSWQPVALPSKHPHVDVMAVTSHPEDVRTVYVATHEAGVFKTTDGGKSWQAVSAGLAGVDVHGLAVDPREPQKLHAAVRDKGEGIYRSTDGGAEWVRVDDGPGGEVKVLASVDISTGMGGIFLYAGTAAGLQRNPDCF
jgi:photosystem II stability/assembly factor-like uncharacterized protein